MCKLFLKFLLVLPFTVHASLIDYDLNYDGKFNQYELEQYEEQTGESRYDLRGGLYLEPESMQPAYYELYEEDGVEY